MNITELSYKDNTVYTKIYNSPEINTREILRYAGVRTDVPEIKEVLNDCLDEIAGQLVYKVCYRTFPIATNGKMLDFGFCKVKSEALAKNLTGCEGILLFGATVGIGLDRLMARYSRMSPSKAFMFQAIGAERIEALCDAFCKDVSASLLSDGRRACPRFSPGYGDLELEIQKDIFAVLDCPRKIGLTLNESLLMSPTKSVTAIVGIKKSTNTD